MNDTMNTVVENNEWHLNDRSKAINVTNLEDMITRYVMTLKRSGGKGLTVIERSLK